MRRYLTYMAGQGAFLALMAAMGCASLRLLLTTFLHQTMPHVKFHQKRDESSDRLKQNGPTLMLFRLSLPVFHLAGDRVKRTRDEKKTNTSFAPRPTQRQSCMDLVSISTLHINQHTWFKLRLSIPRLKPTVHPIRAPILTTNTKWLK